jgi:hypothetical protein
MINTEPSQYGSLDRLIIGPCHQEEMKIYPFSIQQGRDRSAEVWRYHMKAVKIKAPAKTIPRKSSIQLLCAAGAPGGVIIDHLRWSIYRR